jgi:hypothetical protein
MAAATSAAVTGRGRRCSGGVEALAPSRPDDRTRAEGPCLRGNGVDLGRRAFAPEGANMVVPAGGGHRRRPDRRERRHG